MIQQNNPHYKRAYVVCDSYGTSITKGQLPFPYPYPEHYALWSSNTESPVKNSICKGCCVCRCDAGTEQLTCCHLKPLWGYTWMSASNEGQWQPAANGKVKHRQKRTNRQKKIHPIKKCSKNNRSKLFFVQSLHPRETLIIILKS